MCTFRMSTGFTVRPAYVTDYTTIERTDLGCATTPKNRCMLTPGTRTIGTLITHHLSPLTQSAWPAFFPLMDFRLSSMNVCSLSKRWLPLSLRRQDQNGRCSGIRTHGLFSQASWCIQSTVLCRDGLSNPSANLSPTSVIQRW